MSRYLYSYDGSGLPLTCAVKVLRWFPECDDDPTDAIVVFPEFVPPYDYHTELTSTLAPGARWVKAACIVSETPPPASFNFLD